MAQSYGTTRSATANGTETTTVGIPNAPKPPSVVSEHENMPKFENLGGTQPKILDEDFIKDFVTKTVDEVIGDFEYSHDETNGWVNQIVERVVRSLVKVDRDNKYIGKFQIQIVYQV